MSKLDNLPTIMFPVASVIVGEDRQRHKAEADAALINSIETHGLINAILIHEDGRLIAGERRLDAHRKLGLESIKACIVEALPPVIAFELELAENLARKQLSWQEETKAVAGYHALRLDAFAGWTQLGTGNALGISQAKVANILKVAEHLSEEDVASCPTFQGAYNLILGRAERALVAAQSRGLEVAGMAALSFQPNIPFGATKEERTKALLDSVNITQNGAATVEEIDQNLAKIDAGRLAEAALLAEREATAFSDMVVDGDFLEWASTYEGPKFDVLHVDFPYGKDYKGSNTRKTGPAHINPLYADNPDIFFGLVEGLHNVQDNITFSAAHCLFWFDMLYYDWTVKAFEAAGWKLVQPFPLIWTKGFTGVASDPKRRPRHCYETALLFSRGDRKLSKLTNDHFEHGVDEKLHLNQKPQPMLRHFLSLIVDEHTALLDPTCGSGSALAAAVQLKAARVLGVELDPSNAEVARFMLKRDGGKKVEETKDLTAEEEADAA